MAAALERSERAARDARRILRRQIRKALETLASRGSDDEAIHDARKAIKRARATLRLVRGVISKREYRRGNRLLRDAAQPLSAARDAKILVEACDGLLHRAPRARAIAGTRRLRETLRRARSATRRALLRTGQLERSCRLLSQARRAAARWSLPRDTFATLAAGAQRVYAQGREAMQRVRLEPSVGCLHEWRKQAKYLYLQLELLAPLYGPAVSNMAQRFEALSDELGKDHDLALLRLSVAAHSRDFRTESAASELATLIERTRTALQGRALLRGTRLYQPEPAGFVRRLSRGRAPRRAGRAL